MTLAAAQNVSRRLNQECFCITLDQAGLQQGLASEIGDAHQVAALMAARPHMFSDTPVFLPAAEISAMLLTVRAIEAVARLPGYRKTVLRWAPSIASYDPGPLGAFMGYDFHLTDDGPKLIEVNTNAGGAFLNAHLIPAQSACCTEVDSALLGKPRRVAIVDDQTEQQYLYPEFLLAQRLLERHGF